MARHSHGARALVAALICGSLLGCNRTFAVNEKVQGTLRMNGKALPNVRVDFYPQLGPDNAAPTSGGYTDDEGRFTLKCANGQSGAVVAKHKVVLLRGRAPASDEEKQSSDQPLKLAPPIPSAYSTASKTPLEIEVTMDRSEYELVVVP